MTEAKKLFLPVHLVLPFIIFFEGFIAIALEILTIRQLLPVVGNSVIVTSLIIGVFLLFLAYGYRKGGTYIERYREILMRNFTFAAVGLGVGLSYFFIEEFFHFFERLSHGYIIVPLIFYLLVVIAPLVYLLGQTIPIALNFHKKEQTVGAIGGQVLHTSTLGSFLGAILTSLLLMNYFGVAWTVFIGFCILLLLVILLSHPLENVARIALLMGVGMVVYGINVQWENKLFVLTDNYANYQVIDHITLNHERGRMLLINDLPSSFIGENKEVFPYIALIKNILFDDLKLHNKNILVLGAGGFTLSAGEGSDNHFTYVDIDEKIASLVKKHFLPKIIGDFVAKDARQFLNDPPQQYDAVVIDTYSNEYSIPAHLLTVEYFTTLKNVLTPHGVAVFNVIANPMLTDNYSKHVDNTIRAVFGNCMAIPIDYTEKLTNIIYVCKKSSNETDDEIYSDNLNRATWDHFKGN